MSDGKVRAFHVDDKDWKDTTQTSLQPWNLCHFRKAENR